MAISEDKRKLLYKIAKSYYEDDLTQGQIGKRFGLSRIKVSRLLQQARDEKVVQITIVPPQESNVDLERALESTYGLDEVIIITPSSYDNQTIVRELGPPTADYLIRSLQGKEVLGLSWGTTLLAVVDALPIQSWPEMQVVQILGGLGRPEADTHGSDLTWRMAQAFGTRLRILPAPGIVKDKRVRDALLADPQIADTLALAARAEVAIVGIGRPTPGSVVLNAGILTETELTHLEALGAVGDIALRFFDATGEPVMHEICDRIIGLDLDQIKQIPRVIGVAGGQEKVPVIRAALQNHLVNVLVTDDQTASQLLNEPTQANEPQLEVTSALAS